jgi:hypothetical protein
VDNDVLHIVGGASLSLLKLLLLLTLLLLLLQGGCA